MVSDVPVGRELGTLLNYRFEDETSPSDPHVHIGLWTVTDEDICDVRPTTGTERTAVPFDGAYELDGQAFPKGQDHEDKVVTSTNTGTGGTTTDPSPDAKPPVDKPPAPRPAGLPARVPWTPGEAHRLLSAYDPDAPEGQGLVFAGTRDSVVYPLFWGDVVYAGCGTGRSAPLGLMVVVRTEVEGKPYLAVYGHLSAIEPDLVATAPLAAGRVDIDDPIGRFGATVTGVPFDDCSGSDGGPDRLYVGLLRGATVSPSGEISGGRAIYPEPLVGLGAYEGFRWWAGNPVAVDPADGIGTPRGKWANKATPDGKTVDFGDSVKLIARVKDDVPIREVRFTGWYQDWVRPKPLERLTKDGFDPKRVWRILAVCRPPGVSGEPNSTPGCRWDGSATEAVVRFDWDPTAPVDQKITPWQPLSRVAITEDSPDCVPVSLSFDIYDEAGYRALSPDGVKRYERCRAATDKPGKVVNLEPPRPPAAPGNVRITCAPKWEVEARGPEGPMMFACLGPTGTVRWVDRADNEEGYRVYYRLGGWQPKGDPCSGNWKEASTDWRLLAELPANTTAWTGRVRAVDALLPDNDWIRYEATLRVAAYNDHGELWRDVEGGALARDNYDRLCP